MDWILKYGVLEYCQLPDTIFNLLPLQELSLTANAEAGTIVSMAVYRNGTKVMRSFRPDFLLVRQNLRDAGEDNKNLLLGFKYGGVPSINNLNAIYNFQVGLNQSPKENSYPSLPKLSQNPTFGSRINKLLIKFSFLFRISLGFLGICYNYNVDLEKKISH